MLFIFYFANYEQPLFKKCFTNYAFFKCSSFMGRNHRVPKMNRNMRYK